MGKGERERETFLGAKVQRPGDRPCIPYERSVYVSMWAGRTEGASLSAPAGGRTARALSLSLSRSLALFCSLALSRLRLLSVSRCRQHGLLPRQLISLPLSLHLAPVHGREEVVREWGGRREEKGGGRESSRFRCHAVW